MCWLLCCLVQEDYDGAEPAASSIALANLWRFAGLSGGEVGNRDSELSAVCQQPRRPPCPVSIMETTPGLPVTHITAAN